MKKMIMTLMLAIAGSVWTMSEAACYPQEPDNLALQYITVSGTIQYLGTPCEEGEVCPPCLTPAIVTSDKTYYLTTSNQAVQNFLEHMETSPVPSIYSLPLQAKASGTPFTRGNYNFLIVSDINSLYVQYFSDRLDIPSLCDEWNVLEFRSHMGSIPDEYYMRHYRLTTDTVIGEQRYIQLYKDQTYKGAMREGNNRDIYYIPAYTTHEYLLYAFNAQVGDQLLDLWVGSTMDEVFSKEYFPSGVNATVEEIIDTTPRRFVLSISYVTTEEGVENYPYYFEWIEGIGLGSAPDGATNPLPYPGGFSSFLLCAYKNGEQVYVSESGEKYGCEYNVEQPRLPSLCDEWNVWYEGFESYGPINFNHLIKYQLTTDTIINEQRYVKLVSDEEYSPYRGALREGNNRDVYYIPTGSTHEYLLYAFNANVGDRLTNLYLGDLGEETGYDGVVESISDGLPRVFTLRIAYPMEENMESGDSFLVRWIEGVGSSETPMGMAAVPSMTVAADVGVYTLLCAYKNGEQVYVSESGEKYGCEYNVEQPRLPSLCDEWNILEHLIALGPEYESFNTLHYRLTTDTIINGTRYVRFELDGAYKGAMREGDNRDIYYVPAGSAHEYLLYAFNAKVGDKLENLWFGANEDNSYIINSATVAKIESTTPRKYTIDIEWQIICSKDTLESQHSDLVWLEELGFQDGGPLNYECPLNCGGFPVRLILCAYKNGEQVYVSEAGQEYGCEYNGEEPMFTSDTRWDYVYTEMYGGPDYKPTYFSIGPIDTLINHIRYQQIRGFLFRSKGAKVWCLLDSMEIPVERLVYDFDLQIGDSIRKWGTEDYLDPTPKYAKVTKVENIILPDGRSARRLSYDYRPDDIEHIGSVDGIFAPLNLPISTCGCGDHFLCCTRGDILLYEVAEGACDTFFVDNRPYADTIPLFRDGPGSSTVQPVDPNQIVAVLQMDVLSIFEHIGKEIGYKLTVLSSSENASASRRMVKSDTFEQSVSVSLAESGTYMLELTNPDWDYTIVGTFEYNSPHGIEPVETSVPAAQKILQNGQLLIRKGEKIYTLTGVQIQ